MYRGDKDGVYIEIIGSVHEGGSVHNSPVTVEDNRTINPDQRIVNPVIINLHLHVNEIPEGAKGFVHKILGGLLNAITKERHEKIENIERLSSDDIQGRIIRGCKNE